MLVLSRKESEAIRIGDTIQVVVLGIRGKSVKLGIECPREVAVHREEIYLQLQADREAEEEVEAPTFTIVEAELDSADREELGALDSQPA